VARDPDCVFCSIIAGDLEAEVVHGDEHTVAFLDKRPLFPGHTLLVPREHHATIEDLPPTLVEPLFANARTLAAAVRRAMGSEGTFVAVNNTVSQSVPHLHVHVVPRVRRDGLRGFFWPRNPYDDDAHMAATAERIRDELRPAQRGA
jgi:histidine triad (HIT) family protein